jgi:CRP-like cAMP-binding protein
VGRKSSKQQEIIDTANTAMENVNLPQTLRKEIREYFKTVMQTMSQSGELEQFF